MPRIRTVKPEFWSDEKLAPLAVTDRLVFLGLVGMADDAGRVIDSLRAVDGFIFPLTDDTSGESLARLATLGRIERGATESGQGIIQIVNWTTHQRIDKPNLFGALPPIAAPKTSAKPSRRDAAASKTGETRSSEDSATSRRNVDDASALRPTTYDQGPAINDQGPPTQDQRPTTNDPANQGFELFLEAWRATHGTALSSGMAANSLTPIIQELGHDEALDRWRRYLGGTELRYSSVTSFATKHPAYAYDAYRGRPCDDQRMMKFAASDRPIKTENF